MKKILLSLALSALLCSCSASYDYADEIISVYEEAVDDFADAESLGELQQMRNDMNAKCEQLKEEEKESRQELIQAIEQFDEDAYLIKLEILTAESHALWMYHVKEHELKK